MKTSHREPASPDARSVNDTHQTLMTSKTILLLVSVFLSMFLVALDRTIVSTAIPAITNEFHSLPDVGWYGSAYLLTCCSFQLLCGKFYKLYSIKTVYLASVLLFEIGSVICGAAPISATFIAGRALAGVGAAGIFAGTVSLPSSPPDYIGILTELCPDCHHSIYRSLAQAGQDSRSFRCCVWYIVRYWPFGRRSLHIPRNLALVFLHQSASRDRGNGRYRPLSQHARPGHDQAVLD